MPAFPGKLAGIWPSKGPESVFPAPFAEEEIAKFASGDSRSPLLIASSKLKSVAK